MVSYEEHTTYREIQQQPRLWRETLEIIDKNRGEIEDFMKRALNSDSLRVILSGAGSSAYIGETVAPHINRSTRFDVEAVATTDIVAAPESYLRKKKPTLLVSYARSGNSPESEGTFDLVNEIVDETYHIVLTCNREGRLAKKGEANQNALVLYMPEDANDQGLAMTGSFSTMALASLLMFDLDDFSKHRSIVENIARFGEDMMRSKQLEEVAELGFEKAVYLGSSHFKGLAKEAELKMLELTAGRIATRSDTPLGFRHGPKSFIDDKTMVLLFLSGETYTQRYEKDLLDELEQDGMTTDIVIGRDENRENVLADVYIGLSGETKTIPDAFLSLPYLIAAQRLAFLRSYKQGVDPDNPSPDGVINRVVKGVTLYPYEKEGS